MIPRVAARWVLDAGIAAKWYLPDEPLLSEAISVLRDYKRGNVELLVPDLFWLEFGNVLWKAVRKERISAANADRAIASLAIGTIPTIRTESLLVNAFAIASSRNRTVYDSIYVALAIESDCELLTADERLVNALGTRFPVRWLGGIQASAY